MTAAEMVDLFEEYSRRAAEAERRTRDEEQRRQRLNNRIGMLESYLREVDGQLAIQHAEAAWKAKGYGL